jgi:hypothetical protein
MISYDVELQKLKELRERRAVTLEPKISTIQPKEVL